MDIEVTPDDADRRNYNVSFEKIKRVLGFEVERSVPDGVSEIYEALKVRSNRGHCQDVDGRLVPNDDRGGPSPRSSAPQ